MVREFWWAVPRVPRFDFDLGFTADVSPVPCEVRRYGGGYDYVAMAGWEVAESLENVVLIARIEPPQYNPEASDA